MEFQNRFNRAFHLDELKELIREFFLYFDLDSSVRHLVEGIDLKNGWTSNSRVSVFLCKRRSCIFVYFIFRMLVKYWKQIVIEGGIKTSPLVPLRLSLDEVFQRWVIVQLQSLENQKRRMINKIKSDSFSV